MCGGDSDAGGSRREITLPREVSYCIVAVGEEGDGGNQQPFLTCCVATGVGVPLAASELLSVEIHPVRPMPVLSLCRFAVRRVLAKARGGRNCMRSRISPSLSTQVLGYSVPSS